MSRGQERKCNMMFHPHSSLRWATLILSMIILLAAQVILVQAGQEPAPAQAAAKKGQLKGRQPGLNQIARVGEPITVEFLNQYLFGQNRSELNMRKRFENQLDSEIGDLSQTCLLTPAQKTLAELAGRGDIVRFFHPFEEFRQRYQGVPLSTDLLKEIRQDTRLLQLKLSIVWSGEHSLLYKTLANSLQADQIARFNTWKASRRRAIHQAAVNSAIQVIRTAPAPISRDRQQQLTRFLLRETQSPPISVPGWDAYFILLQVGRWEKSKLAKAFDEADLATLNDSMEAVRNLEPMMRSLGYFQDEDEIGAAPATTKR